MKAVNGRNVRGALITLAACLFACAGLARGEFLFSEPTKVPNVNSGFGDGSPKISRDGLTLYFNSNREHTEGECYCNIWVSRRPTPGSPWSTPVKLDAPVNGPGSEHCPSVSADGLELYFSDAYPRFDQWGGCMPNPNGYGHADLWVSRRGSTDEPWGVPENLGPVVNSAGAEDAPCISANGLELYFMHEDPVGETYGPHSDIVVTTRATKADPWGEPVNLGPNVNSSMYEYAPWVSPDGLSLFFSRGFSKAHLYVCRRVTESDPWGPAEFLLPLNSGTSVYQDMPGETEFCLSFCYGASTLYFTRGTDLFSWDYNIWQVTTTPVTDFNHDGVTDASDLSLLTDHWGQAGSSYDIGPLPVGDGLVADADLEVFYDHVDGNLVVVPTPALNATDATPFVSLNWTRRTLAEAFDVYLGTSFDDVYDASRDNPLGVLVSRGQTINTYDPEDVLNHGQTYHWRVDEVRDQSASDVSKGIVWSFTVRPYSESPSESINVLSTSASSAINGAGPEHTIDGSGFNADDLHSTVGSAMWLSAADGPQPTWIQYEFDAVYPLR